jgi:hypothetical protein
MELQDYIEKSMAYLRSKSLSNSDQLTLGEMILKLEPIVEKQKERVSNKHDEARVVYDFEELYPTDIESWRGSYSELALNFKTENSYPDDKRLTVTEFFKLLKETVGREFTGYKGGEFKMNKMTPVWVANYGNAGNTAVIDIIDNDYEIIIMTGYRNYITD